MLKDKLKQNPQNVKVNPILLDACREYCQKHGMKLSWYVSKSLEEKLERDTKVS